MNILSIPLDKLQFFPHRYSERRSRIFLLMPMLLNMDVLLKIVLLLFFPYPFQAFRLGFVLPHKDFKN